MSSPVEVAESTSRKAVAYATRKEQLPERLRDLASLRRRAAELKASLEARKAAFDTEHAALIAEAKSASEEVSVAEGAVKLLGLEMYHLDRSQKQLAPGVTVKEKSTLHYSLDDALAWARETKLALLPESVDVKSFEKIAKATAIDFVVTIIEPQVQLASDLDAALAAGV